MPDEPLQVIDAEASPRLPRPPMRYGRGGARGVRPAVAVVAVTVLALGVLGGGLTFGDPGPSDLDGSAACSAVEPEARSPELHLGIRGSTAAVVGFAHAPDPSPAWILPELSEAFAAEADDRLEFRFTQRACLAAILVEIGPGHANEPPLPTERELLVDEIYDRPRHQVELAPVSPGAWVIRAVATWWTGDVGPELRTEAFFRVHIGDAAGLSTPRTDASSTPPPPLVTPVASCGPVDDLQGLRLTIGNEGVEPVAGAPLDGELPVVELAAGIPVDLQVEGDACATSWQIDLRQDDVISTLDAQPNVENDPARAVQNRWQLALPQGDAVVVAVLRFGQQGVVEQGWTVRVLPFVPPAATLRESGGAGYPTSAGCALSVFLANSFSAANSCDVVPEAIADLPLEAGTPLELVLEGWTITSWSGECGRVEPGELGPAFGPGGCSLGGFTISDGATPPPVRFVVPSTALDRVLRLQVTASRAGDEVVAVYYVRVPAR